MLMYQSFISCEFEESPGGDLLLESQSVLRIVFYYRDLSFYFLCTTATKTQDTPLPGLHAVFEWEVSKYDFIKAPPPVDSP